MSDEQLREQFESAVFVHLGVDEEAFAKLEGKPDVYADPLIQSMWNGYAARDAEVQALRELLTQVTEELAEEVTGNYKARYGDPIHPAMEGRYARDMDTVYRARKLLAGGETGETE